MFMKSPAAIIGDGDMFGSRRDAPKWIGSASWGLLSHGRPLGFRLPRAQITSLATRFRTTCRTGVAGDKSDRTADQKTRHVCAWSFIRPRGSSRIRRN